MGELDSPHRVEPFFRLNPLGRALRAIFILPRSQTQIFDLGYQLYAFELFHQRPLNRWVHFVGIPLSVVATYTFMVEVGGGFGLMAAALLIGGIHLALAIRYRLWALVPAVLAAHALLATVATLVLTSWLPANGPFYFRPSCYILVGPVAQYFAHIGEPKVPPPMSGCEGWRDFSDYFRRSPPSLLLMALLCAPLHAGVEIVSSHRNFFLEILLSARALGYRHTFVARSMAWIKVACQAPEPILDYAEFVREFGQIDAPYREVDGPSRAEETCA